MLWVWFLLQILTWVYTMRRKYIFINPEKEERERIYFNEEVTLQWESSRKKRGNPRECPKSYVFLLHGPES